MDSETAQKMTELTRKLADTRAAQLAAFKENATAQKQMDAQLFVVRQIIEILIKSHPAVDLLNKHLKEYCSFALMQDALDKAQHPQKWDNPYAAIWQQAVQDELKHWSAVVSGKTSDS